MIQKNIILGVGALILVLMTTLAWVELKPATPVSEGGAPSSDLSTSVTTETQVDSDYPAAESDEVGATTETSGSSSTGKTVTFIHFNDLHAHLEPHADLVPDAPVGQTAKKTKIVMRGGLARTATLIKDIRKTHPHSVLMNIGDTYHGGVEALYTNGNAIVDPVNALGVDVGVPGNWDFAYGPLVTRLRYFDPNDQSVQMLSKLAGSFMPAGEVKRPNFPNLAANITTTMPPAKAGQHPLPPNLIKEIGGVKVGFIGITSDIVPMMYGPLAMGLNFVQGENNYKSLINEQAKIVRDKGAQIVVVMSELGLQKDYRLAQIVNKGAVDVFFSAHTHEAVFTPLTSTSGAVVVEAGNDGYVGQMDVTIDGGKVVARKWKLIAVGSEIAEDPAMKKLVAAARAPFLAKNPNMKMPMPISDQELKQSITTVVGHSDGIMDRRNALESTFNDAFTEALRKKAGTKLALSPGFRFDAVIGKSGTVPIEDGAVVDGSITLEDVYRFFPVSYTISKGEVTGKRIKEIMEDTLTHVYSPNIFYQGGGWFDGVGGLKGKVNLQGTDGSRVSDLSVIDTGKVLNDSDVLSIVGCTRPMEDEDVLCSYSGFTNVEPLTDASGRQWTVADIFTDMLAHGTLKATNKHFTETSNTIVWPQSPYIQPLKGTGTASASTPTPTVDTSTQSSGRPMMDMMRQRLGQ